MSERLIKLRKMLKARTRNGEALPGFAENVAAIRKEIERLEGNGETDAA